jgi:hypothetical protein
MSSIKRNVKKNFSFDRRPRSFFDIQPTVYVSAPDWLRGFALDGFSFVWFSLPVVTLPVGSARLRKRA